ncbi:glutaredoxin family protein [Paenibacillus sp. FSL M7-0802]|uniref:glutaredoxin family protein n=1 Tax=Paenibacillus TaxID=44249 RepID=UPI0003D37BCE|nr:glutaredoxin family protein [Paenibacillus polymyxa]AHC19040.1 hypothetical protein X809_07310 [Paenibacillus polymyxa CR1]
MHITLYYKNNCRYCEKLKITLSKLANEDGFSLQMIDAELEKNPLDTVPKAVIKYKGHEIGRFSSALDKVVIKNYLALLRDYIKKNKAYFD